MMVAVMTAEVAAAVVVIVVGVGDGGSCIGGGVDWWGLWRARGDWSWETR
jgi:hypothetical protein